MFDAVGDHAAAIVVVAVVVAALVDAVVVVVVVGNKLPHLPSSASVLTQSKARLTNGCDVLQMITRHKHICVCWVFQEQ